MTLRSTALALLAGSAVALGGMFGAAADTTTATLSPNATGACFPSIAATTNLGAFAWNGSAYTGTSGAFVVTSTQTTSPLNIDCTYTISGGDLTHATDSTQILNAGDITLADSGSATTGVLDPGINVTVSTPTGAGTTRTINTELSAALQQHAPGSYTGTVTVTVVTGEGI